MKPNSLPPARQQVLTHSPILDPWEGAQWPPRRWQAEALPLALESINSGKRQVVQAVMGAGKSALIAEIVRSLNPTTEQPVVVSCPTRALVTQLAERIQTRNPHLDVGTFYTSSKKVRPITIVCVPSLQSFAAKLKHKPQAWIIDECHGSQANTVLAASQALEPAAILGVTATPFRSDDKERLTLFDEDGLIYSYTAGDALNDGVVVPWVVRKWHGLNIASNDDEEDDSQCTLLDDACISMISNALEDGVGCGVVDADTIADAEQFASRLRTQDIAALAVHCRLKPREVAERIEWLRTGEIDVLVHVAMLKEGVDLPWLRWLCLRRKVGSKVWFAQHVGRVLRSFEGKEHAVILDPSCLFEKFQLDYEAVLGGICTEAEPMAEENEEESVGRGKQPREAVRVKMLEEWLRRVYNVLRAQGLIDQFAGYSSTWRKHSITLKQISGLEKVAQFKRLKRAVKRLDPMIADVLRMAYRHRNYLSKGGGADLLSVMYNLHKATWSKQAIRMVLA